jgi:hypothetical protein
LGQVPSSATARIGGTGSPVVAEAILIVESDLGQPLASVAPGSKIARVQPFRARSLMGQINSYRGLKLSKGG